MQHLPVWMDGALDTAIAQAEYTPNSAMGLKSMSFCISGQLHFKKQVSPGQAPSMDAILSPLKALEQQYFPLQLLLRLLWLLFYKLDLQRIRCHSKNGFLRHSVPIPNQVHATCHDLRIPYFFPHCLISSLYSGLSFIDLSKYIMFSHTFFNEMRSANLFFSRALFILFKYLISQESGSILRMRGEPCLYPCILGEIPAASTKWAFIFPALPTYINHSQWAK